MRFLEILWSVIKACKLLFGLVWAMVSSITIVLGTLYLASFSILLAIVFFITMLLLVIASVLWISEKILD